MADYSEERQALTDARLRLDEVFAAPGSREPMHRTLCNVLSVLSDELETYEDWNGPIEPGDSMVLGLLEKIQKKITEELG
jgi:hypothetical protein